MNLLKTLVEYYKFKPHIGAQYKLKRYKNVLKTNREKFIYVVLKEL